MATFQVVVGDPDTGEAHDFSVDEQAANRFLGREIGDEVVQINAKVAERGDRSIEELLADDDGTNDEGEDEDD